MSECGFDVVIPDECRKSDQVKGNSWLTFKIKGRLLSDTGGTGFEMVTPERNRYRYSPAGEPLPYYVITGRKTKDIERN